MENGPINELTAALAVAQQKIKRVAHDAVNQHHRYGYTSAEAMIEAAKEGLADTGLAVIPISQEVVASDPTPVWDAEGKVIGQVPRENLVSHIMLSHVSGQTMISKRIQPIVVQKGRLDDKALSSAATTLMGYYYRDLLLMPRYGKDEDVNARDDSNHHPAAQPAPATNRESPRPQEAGGDDAAKLAAAIVQWTTYIQKLTDPAVLTSVWGKLRQEKKELGTPLINLLTNHVTKLGYRINWERMLIDLPASPPAEAQTPPPTQQSTPPPARVGADPTQFANGVDSWRTQIQQITTPEALSALIPAVSQLPSPLVQTVKKLMFDLAGEHGWLYVQAEKQFKRESNF